jgi:demethylmenaquinone methyltransferase/2-methoxy-6-polyprenyl-1,4-benzoquinol methylase
MPAHDGAGAGTAARGPAPPDPSEPPAGERPAEKPRSTETLAGESSPGRLQAAQVRAMFDRIAGVYDVMNTVMTAGLHHRWRARAADLAAIGPGSRVLDVATGTGDMALELARRVSPGGEVVGSDFAEAMLSRARAKAAARGAALVQPCFEPGDALALPYGESSFDAATVAFGVRNFSDLPRGLAELARVVRPGGRVVVLEITTPTHAPLSLFYRLWFDRLVPVLGRIAGALASLASRRGRDGRGAGVAAAYSYLPSSVRRFPTPDVLAAEMRRAGLRDVAYELVAGSIIAIHAGTVPEEQA